MNKLKLLDLFSGIGGFSYGLESTNGFETIAFCEKDKFCQKVLKKHWNDIKIYEDVRNIKGSEIKADVITGGFPCQPFSVAGKRRGTDDDRYLWDETLRVIAETKPKWFVGENVEGIINIKEGKVLQQIQKDLEAESFQVQCLIIPASGIGAWHQRKRVWIIGYSDSNGSYRQKTNETIESSNKSKDWLFVGNDKDVSNSNINSSKIGRNDYADEKIGGKRNLYKGESGSYDKRKFNSKKNAEMEYVSNSNGRLRGRRTTIGESGENEVRRIYSSKEEQARNDLRSKAIGCNAVSGKTNTNSNSSRQQEFNISKKSNRKINGSRQHVEEQDYKSWWQTQSELCGVPDGISYGLDKDRANRIKSLGNSIVPEIAKEIGLAILKAEDEQIYKR